MQSQVIIGSIDFRTPNKILFTMGERTLTPNTFCIPSLIDDEKLEIMKKDGFYIFIAKEIILTDDWRNIIKYIDKKFTLETFTNNTVLVNIEELSIKVPICIKYIIEGKYSSISQNVEDKNVITRLRTLSENFKESNREKHFSIDAYYCTLNDKINENTWNIKYELKYIASNPYSKEILIEEHKGDKDNIIHFEDHKTPVLDYIIKILSDGDFVDYYTNHTEINNLSTLLKKYAPDKHDDILSIPTMKYITRKVIDHIWHEERTSRYYQTYVDENGIEWKRIL